MADQPSAVAGILRRPFREQVAYFRGKLGNLVPTQRWDDISREQHDTAFMVAGAQKADLLADLAAAVDRAVTEGKSLEAFRRDFNAAVARNDWHGWTGEDSKAGRAWRTRTIYRTNASVSYAAGRYAQLRAGNFKFWVYRHGGSQHPRHDHLSWDRVALPPDHPFWATHYPPSDWGCSCYVVGTNSAAGIRRLNGDPDKRLPAGWDKVDPRTGELPGIGKGWGYAPGAGVVSGVEAVAEKVRHWDHQIAKAFMADLPSEQRDRLAEAYRRLPSVEDDARRYARRVLGQGGDATIQPAWTLGAVTSSDIQVVAAMKGLDMAGYDFSLTPSDIKHIRREHGDEKTEARRGQLAIGIDDYRHLPAIIAAPDAISDAGSSAPGEPLILYEKAIGDRRYFAVFALLKNRGTLGLKTFYARRAG